MKPIAVLCLAALPVLPSCETRRYQTPAEVFTGQAIVSFNDTTGIYTLADHLLALRTPVNNVSLLCQIPTTDAVVEAIDALVRTGTPISPDDLYFDPEEVSDSVPDDWRYKPNLVGAVFFDSHGRMVTLGTASMDFDGNYYDVGYDLDDEVDRIVEWEKAEDMCAELNKKYRVLPNP